MQPLWVCFDRWRLARQSPDSTPASPSDSGPAQATNQLERFSCAEVRGGAGSGAAPCHDRSQPGVPRRAPHARARTADRSARVAGTDTGPALGHRRSGGGEVRWATCRLDRRAVGERRLTPSRTAGATDPLHAPRRVLASPHHRLRPQPLLQQLHSTPTTTARPPRPLGSWPHRHATMGRRTHFVTSPTASTCE